MRDQIPFIQFQESKLSIFPQNGRKSQNDVTFTLKRLYFLKKFCFQWLNFFSGKTLKEINFLTHLNYVLSYMIYLIKLSVRSVLYNVIWEMQESQFLVIWSVCLTITLLFLYVCICFLLFCFVEHVHWSEEKLLWNESHFLTDFHYKIRSAYPQEKVTQMRLKHPVKQLIKAQAGLNICKGSQLQFCFKDSQENHIKILFQPVPTTWNSTKIILAGAKQRLIICNLVQLSLL